MDVVIACACGLDPATESMAAQLAIAAALSTPYWFRDRIREAIRRFRGRSPEGCDRPVKEVEPD
jgi:hypothetical protein